MEFIFTFSIIEMPILIWLQNGYTHCWLTFSAFCLSNGDCSDVTGKPFCRQYAKGSIKTCQVKFEFNLSFEP